MKNTLFIFALLCAFYSNAQERAIQDLEKIKKEYETTPEGWKRGGTIGLLFNQSAFNNNWLAGGTSNIAGNLNLNYDLNYKKGDNVWDNKLIIGYGLTRLKGTTTNTKTDDKLELNSLFGKKATGDWYYSAFLNLKTQMDSGNDINGNKISHFFSPAYLQFGPGMLWKKSDNLKVNFAPATSRLIFVHKHFTDFGSSFGVLQGNSSRFEFGASISTYYKFNIMTNVSVENRLNLYSNYLNQPQNIDIDYQMNLAMKVNKYMSANIVLQTIYDDNSIKAAQVREVLGLGINYNF